VVINTATKKLKQPTLLEVAHEMAKEYEANIIDADTSSLPSTIKINGLCRFRQIFAIADGMRCENFFN
jgi:hypothetical protein